MNLQHLKIDHTWTLFLDRDGVINSRIVDDYVKTWDQFVFLPGVLDAMKEFHRVFGRIIVVSNQQGVGKGLMSDKEVQAVHQRMMEEISNAGGKTDAVFYAPNLQSERSVMRKPNIGMALKARKQFSEICFKRSIMAGDSLSDMIFGKRVGMKTVLISTSPALSQKYPGQIDLLFPDLICLAHAL
jgi:histidinol-phosphate phosphatase family protein